MCKATIILLILVTSCAQSLPSDNLKEISVKYVDREHNEKLSDIVSEVKYLKLETKPDFLMGTIKKVEIFDKIYCLSANKINVLSLDGKALFEINHFGRKSPEGYHNITNFRVDTLNNIIEVFDRLLRKVIRYNSNDGTFLSSQIFNVAAFDFIKDSENNYYFYTGYQPHFFKDKNEVYHILKFNSNGEFLNRYLKESDNKKTSFSTPTIFYSFNGSIYFNPTANNYVYYYNEDAFHEIFRFNFGKYQLDDDYFKNMPHWTTIDIRSTNYAFNPGIFREYNYGYFYGFIKGERELYRGFISKTTKRNLICGNFINDFDGGWPIWIQIVQDDLFITCFDAYTPRKYYYEIKKRSSVKEWEKFREKSGQFCSIVEGLNDTDNPVLVLMKPKEF